MSIRDIIVGVLGTLLGGFVVWLISDNFRMASEIKANELTVKARDTINSQIFDLVSHSERAKLKAEETLLSVEESLVRANKASIKIENINRSIDATPLFSNIEKSMDEIRKFITGEIERISTVKIDGIDFRKNFSVLEGATNGKGEFSIPHSIEDYNQINGVLVSVKHENGWWYTIDQSDVIKNRFFWTQTDIVGGIYLPNFFNKPVKVLLLQ